MADYPFLTPECVRGAFQLFLRFQREALPEYREPLINVMPIDEMNACNVVMEWWQDPRKLTVYVEPDGSMNYVKCWGANVHEEMESGSIEDAFTPTVLWFWLESPEKAESLLKTLAKK